MAKSLGALNSFLASRTFLLGDTITLADIVTACTLYYGFVGIFDAKYSADYPHVTRYFFTLVNQPKFKSVMGEVTQCKETPTDVVPPEKNPWRTAPAAPAAVTQKVCHG